MKTSEMGNHCKNLGDIIRFHEDLDKTALIDLHEAHGGRAYSFREIDNLANGVSRALISRGLTRGDRVALIAENRSEFLVTFLGAMRAGIVPVPVNYKLTKEVVFAILEDSEVKLLFVDGKGLALCPSHLPTVLYDSQQEESFDNFIDIGEFESVSPLPGEYAAIMYTSGSGGRPKGVPLTHEGQLWALEEIAEQNMEQYRLLVAAPPYHMNGLFAQLLSLYTHASVVTLPSFKAKRYIEAIDKYECSWITGVPTMMALLTYEQDLLKKTNLKSVQAVTMGSAPLTGKLYDSVAALFSDAKIMNGYGTTEVGPVIFGQHPDGLQSPPLSLGFPAASISWRLVGGVNEDEGELLLKSPSLMSGYLNMPEETAKRVNDGWYSTGDMMRRDKEGFFYFVGRMDDMFVCGGENIYPVEVESMLERHPDIHQSCVVAVEDEIKGHIPVTFIVVRNGASLSVEDVKDYSLKHAPTYQHPRYVWFVNKLPLAGTNKIDRRKLETRARNKLGLDT